MINVKLDKKAKATVSKTLDLGGGGGTVTYREGSLVPLKAGDKIYLDLSKASELYIDDDYNANYWAWGVEFKYAANYPISTSNGCIIEDEAEYFEDITGSYLDSPLIFIFANEQRNQLFVSIGDGQGGGEHDQYGDIIDAQLIYEGELPPAPSGYREKAELSSDIIEQLPTLEITVTEAMAGKYYSFNWQYGSCLDHIEYVE